MFDLVKSSVLLEILREHQTRLTSESEQKDCSAYSA